MVVRGYKHTRRMGEFYTSGSLTPQPPPATTILEPDINNNNNNNNNYNDNDKNISKVLEVSTSTRSAFPKWATCEFEKANLRYNPNFICLVVIGTLSSLCRVVMVTVLELQQAYFSSMSALVICLKSTATLQPGIKIYEGL